MCSKIKVKTTEHRKYKVQNLATFTNKCLNERKKADKNSNYAFHNRLYLCRQFFVQHKITGTCKQAEHTRNKNETALKRMGNKQKYHSRGTPRKSVKNWLQCHFCGVCLRVCKQKRHNKGKGCTDCREYFISVGCGCSKKIDKKYISDGSES